MIAGWTAVTKEQFAQVRGFAQCGTPTQILPYEFLHTIENPDHPMHFRAERAGRFALDDISFYPTKEYSFGLRMLFAKDGRTPTREMLRNTPTSFSGTGNLYMTWSEYGEQQLARELLALLELKEIRPHTSCKGLEISDLTLCLAPRVMEIEGFNNYQSGEKISIFTRDSLQNKWTFHSDILQRLN